jgi:hypothetical protein
VDSHDWFSLNQVFPTFAYSLQAKIPLGSDRHTLSVSGLGVANRPYCLNTTTNLTPPVVWIQILTNYAAAALMFSAALSRGQYTALVSLVVAA